MRLLLLKQEQGHALCSVPVPCLCAVSSAAAPDCIAAATATATALAARIPAATQGMLLRIDRRHHGREVLRVVQSFAEELGGSQRPLRALPMQGVRSVPARVRRLIGLIGGECHARSKGRDQGRSVCSGDRERRAAGSLSGRQEERRQQ